MSSDAMKKAKWSKEKIGIPFAVLSDANRAVMKLYNTQSLDKYEVPGYPGPYNHATLILIDKTGTICWIYRNPDYRIRSTVAEDLAEIRKLQ